MQVENSFQEVSVNSVENQRVAEESSYLNSQVLSMGIEKTFEVPFQPVLQEQILQEPNNSSCPVRNTIFATFTCFLNFVIIINFFLD